jgi:hypothetical protein
MPKMLDYQKEIVENVSTTTIIGNMPRGGGKDYILACKVLYERPRVCLYMSWTRSQFRPLGENLKGILKSEKIFNNEIKYFHEDKDYIKLIFNNGEITEVYNYNSLKQEDKLLNTYVDMVLYSNCLPQFDIKSKKHIAMVSISYSWLRNMFPCKDIKVYNIGLKELIQNNLTTKEWLDEIKKDDNKLNFRQEFDLFEEYEEIFSVQDDNNKKNKINKENFYNIQIEELMQEYADTPKNRNTTLTRENILKQIQMLQDIKR